jgi:uncharacterized membrane protein YphA (DoxX/SURF4 family)
MAQLARRLEAFLFPIENDAWLAVLRIGIGLQVALYGFSLRFDWDELFSLSATGPVKRDLTEAILSAESRFIPRMGWIVDLAASCGLDERTVLTATWWILLAAGCFLVAGLFSRTAAVAAAFVHLCAVKSTGALTYGFDSFTTIGLFYLVISPLPDRLAADWWLRSKRPKNPHLIGFFRRVLQMHVCLIYFFSGLTKCAGSGWWDGTSIWRALIRPPFNILSADWLISWKHFFPIMGISVCLLETGYPLFIWLRKTRKVWLVAVLAMHVGIGLALGLYLFAFVMMVLNVAAFGPGFAFSLRSQNVRSQAVSASGAA